MKFTQCCRRRGDSIPPWPQALPHPYLPSQSVRKSVQCLENPPTDVSSGLIWQRVNLRSGPMWILIGRTLDYYKSMSFSTPDSSLV